VLELALSRPTTPIDWTEADELALQPSGLSGMENERGEAPIRH